MGVAAAICCGEANPRPKRRLMLSMTLWLLTVLVPLQIFLGDMHGLNTLQHQPAKLAAIEAHWNREARAPLTLFAIPDQQAETNRYAIEVPLLGSLILTHDVNGVVPGLKDFPARRPATGDHSLLRLPHHGGHRPADAGAGGAGAVAAAARPACTTRDWFLQALRWARRWALSPWWRAGPPPKWAASPGRSMA